MKNHLTVAGMFLLAMMCDATADVRTLVEQMRRQETTCSSGVLETLGAYVMVLVELALDGQTSQQEAAELALVHGKKEIAAFIGQTVSSQERFGSSETTVNGKTEAAEFFTSLVAVDVEQFLRGVVLHDMRKTETSVSAVCIATGKAQDMSRELQRQMAENPPDTVSSIGLAYIVDGRLDQAKQQSLHAALRAAVEQVLGTALAGNTQAQDNTKVRSRIFSHASGFVETYRIVSEENVDGCYRTAVYAKVAKDKLLDSYQALLKSFGDPVFYLDAGNKDLYLTFTKFFTDLGLKLTDSMENVDYMINALGDYRALKHPASGVDGVQLSLAIRISDARTGQELLSEKNDPRKSAVFHAAGERQKEIATEKAFAQIKDPLHQALQKMIGRMAAAGRGITVQVDNYSPAYADAVAQLCRSLEMVPGCNGINWKSDPVTQCVTITANYQGKMDDLWNFLSERLKRDIKEERFVPRVTGVEANRLLLTY